MIIATVYWWQSNMLMVFDDRGQQVPVYQGPVEECGDALDAVFPFERWHREYWRPESSLVPGAWQWRPRRLQREREGEE